jgi:hypothetical protein
MKRYGLRILLALLTFTLGLCAAGIVRFRLAPVAKVETVVVSADIQAQLPPPQIAEGAQPMDGVEDDTPLPQKIYKAIHPHLVSISPYEIKRLIDSADGLDLKLVWRKLNIDTADAAFARFNDYDGCYEAKIYKIELDGKLGDETLLKLDFGMPESTLYLIFKHANGQHNVGWNLLGYIPYIYGAPFVPPSQKVLSDGRHHWLVIDYSTGHGSGFGSGADDWFEISQSGVRKVLSYQNGLFIGFQSPTIDRNNKVLKCEYRDGMTTVVIRSATSYGYYDEQTTEPFDLWMNKRNAIFIKLPRMRKFIFDSQHSEMSAKEIDPDYGEWAEISNEDILKYNYRDLKRLAIKGNRKQKEWLRDFIDARDDSVEKQSLQKALEGAQP